MFFVRFQLQTIEISKAFFVCSLFRPMHGTGADGLETRNQPRRLINGRPPPERPIKGRHKNTDKNLAENNRRIMGALSAPIAVTIDDRSLASRRPGIIYETDLRDARRWSRNPEFGNRESLPLDWLMSAPEDLSAACGGDLLPERPGPDPWGRDCRSPPERAGVNWKQIRARSCRLGMGQIQGVSGLNCLALWAASQGRNMGCFLYHWVTTDKFLKDHGIFFNPENSGNFVQSFKFQGISPNSEN